MPTDWGNLAIVQHHAALLGAAEPFMILIVILFIALVVVGIVASIRAAQKRREAMQQLALDLRMDYDSVDHHGPPPGAILFPVFNRGHSRRAYNTITGSIAVGGRSLGIRLGDYQYTVTSGSGKNRRSTTYRISYLLVMLPFAVTEQLGVRREGFFDKLAGAIGFEDIDFESLEFSKQYHVSSSDKKVAYDLFDPRMIDWCLNNPMPPFEIRGHWVLATEQRIWQPADFHRQLDWIASFIERWPTHLVQRLESNASTTPA